MRRRRRLQDEAEDTEDAMLIRSSASEKVSAGEGTGEETSSEDETDMAEAEEPIELAGERASSSSSLTGLFTWCPLGGMRRLSWL